MLRVPYKLRVCSRPVCSSPELVLTPGPLPAQAIQKLSDLYAKQQDAGALRALLTELRPLFAAIPKAKTAKIVRTIIETIAKVPNSTQLQVLALVSSPCMHLFPQRLHASNTASVCHAGPQQAC